MKINSFTRNLAAVFAVIVGLYPLAYFSASIKAHGLLHFKSDELLHNLLWNVALYVHISTGGFALLFGWLQFNRKRRNQHIQIHRILGRCYVVAVILSSIAGFYIAMFATGGLISTIGFATLSLCWLFTIVIAFMSVLRGNINEHRQWMILNYSLTFAAVTLRVWLFLLVVAGHINFLSAYRLISWLCWVPNLLIGCLIVYSQQNRTLAQKPF